MSITYTFIVRDQGVRQTGLTPTFDYYNDPTNAGVYTSPTISEIAEGFYTFDIDWSLAQYNGIDSILFVIDADSNISNPAERYIADRVDRYDIVTTGIAADAAKTSADSADTSASAAETAANSADTSASAAETAANSADASASNAETAANSASASASSAATAASNAETAANSAATAASNAETSADAAKASVDELVDIEKGEWELVSDQLILRDPAGVEITRFNLFDLNGDPTTVAPFKRTPVP